MLASYAIKKTCTTTVERMHVKSPFSSHFSSPCFNAGSWQTRQHPQFASSPSGQVLAYESRPSSWSALNFHVASPCRPSITILNQNFFLHTYLKPLDIILLGYRYQIVSRLLAELLFQSILDVDFGISPFSTEDTITVNDLTTLQNLPHAAHGHHYIACFSEAI